MRSFLAASCASRPDRHGLSWRQPAQFIFAGAGEGIFGLVTCSGNASMMLAARSSISGVRRSIASSSLLVIVVPDMIVAEGIHEFSHGTSTDFHRQEIWD